MPKKYAKPNRNKRKPNARQHKFVKALAEGKTLTQAAKEANYSTKNPGQSGYQALAQLRGRVPELLERHGLGEEVLIEKYLKPLLEAEETKFFKDGKIRINVETLAIRHASLRTAFELHRSYAPRDPKEAAQYGVRVIRVDIPRPLNEYNQFIDVIPESALNRHGLTNGTKPAVPRNGKPRTDHED
jgi:hypothetical protein